jgi:hypothetical protein
MHAEPLNYCRGFVRGIGIITETRVSTSVRHRDHSTASCRRGTALSHPRQQANSRRRFLLLALAPALLRADDRTDALDAIAPLASALSDGDAGTVIDRLPRDAPNYAELRSNVSALITQAQVTSSVEVLDAASGKAELDWYMEIRSRETGTVVERRRGRVSIRFRGRKLLAIEPASMFAAPKPPPPAG